MSDKCNQTAQFYKRLMKFILILGINTYVLNTSFATEVDTSNFRQKILSKCKSVDSPDKQVNGFDPNSAPSLPIGIAKEINGNKYVICIDSAYFQETGAYFSAYMALELPNADKPLVFAAKDIKFNPEGVQGGEQAKLMLYSDHTLEMGPKTLLHIPGDGSNYVNWGCNGFESVNLHGIFEFSKTILQPVAPDTSVTAEFEVNVQDIQNMYMSVDFSPFTVQGLSDFEFDVSQASVDMSDYVNPPNVQMPQCYHETYPDNIDLWRGFHIQYFGVTLPEKLENDDNPVEIFAYNMFIDDAGVTGVIGATNIIQAGGTEGKWGFTVDSLALGLVTNELVMGSMTGDLQVPMMDSSEIQYLANISKDPQTNNANYYFAINASDTLKANCLKSKIKIDPTSTLSMSVVNDKFRPMLVLNGTWTLDKDDAKFKGLGFQNLTVISQTPFVSQGVFSLIGDEQPKVGGFSVSIDNISLGTNQGRVGFGADIALNLSGQPDSSSTNSNNSNNSNTNTISVSTSVRVWTSVGIDWAENRQKWTYHSFDVHQINIACNTNAFKFNGYINYRKNDPVWGTGFEGELNLEVGDIIPPTAVKCAFGRTESYKYWAVDAKIPLNPGITLGSITLTQLSGGLSWHVQDTRTAQSIIDEAKINILTPNQSMSPNYLPDENTSLGFRAGVQFNYQSEKILNGEVVFSIQFNNNGGLNNILFAGEAFMMCSRAERGQTQNYAKGTVAVNYDHQQRIFDLQAQFNAQFAQKLTANIWSQLYISPNLWYFHLGTPNNQCSVNLHNFASVNGYFMFGQNLPPMPPPPPQVSGVLGGFSSSRNANAIASGNGIGCGMSLSAGFNGEKSISEKWEAYAAGQIGAGFDMTLYKYAPTAYCTELSGPFGANYWFMMGQLYAYGSVQAGARKKDGTRDFPIINASMAMLLQGSLPNPSYVYGGVNLQANVLNLFDINVSCDFDAGQKCTVVQP